MNATTEGEKRARTKAFALRTLAPIDARRGGRSARIVAGQRGRSGLPDGANCRAACRARSVADPASRRTAVAGEAAERAFGPELLAGHGPLSGPQAADFYHEAGELAAIAVAPREALLFGHRESAIENRK